MRVDERREFSELLNEPPRRPRDELVTASFHSQTLPPWSKVP
jgi:hypothetical protein